jgi:hypothetical protein
LRILSTTSYQVTKALIKSMAEVSWKAACVKQPRSDLGQSHHFGPVRRMSAYPLTAAREQTFRDRRYGPENEPAYAGARCARDGVRGNDGGPS